MANLPPKQLSPWQIFLLFLHLGCTSFGGPIAHLGYFRTAFVDERHWLTDRQYAHLVAYCQLMPGPASSQVGILLGFQQRGHAGALAAWLGFTLPSALMMIGLAVGMATHGARLPAGLLHGLEIVAVAVVAQAIWGMARHLYTGLLFAVVALIAGAAALLLTGAWTQLIIICGAALISALASMAHPTYTERALPVQMPKRDGAWLLGLFVILLMTLPLLNQYLGTHGLALFNAFYRSGALVFGGGHVVLPLLQAEVVPTGWVGNADFLAGYGAAQAMPGPLFTFAAYLGAISAVEPTGWLGGSIALIAIFLPAYLLILGGLPFWSAITHHPRAQSALAGVNAAVIGLLMAAFYSPIWQSTVLGITDFLLAVLVLCALMLWNIPVWLVVLVAGMGGGLFL